MTRINTNVSSLVAQNTLQRSNGELQTALTRLSTGLRINRGKDDPAGLIASESLRSDIISTEKAITNSERANQLIATADSALGQVSNLLNDIRGLVSEAANTGAMSDEQIAANQLQIDSSLEAIDRIAQITSFQGRRLLDGSLDFITQNVNGSAVEGLRIDQANFGTQSNIGVEVNVVKQATRGELSYGFGAIAEDLVLEIGGGNGTEAFNFAQGSTIEEIAAAVNLVSDATGVDAKLETAATKGEVTLSSTGANNDVLITANEAGFDAGDLRVNYNVGTSTTTSASYAAPVGGEPGKIDVSLGVSEWENSSVVVDQGGTNNAIRITANNAGEDFNDITVVFTDTETAGGETAVFDQDAKTLTIGIEDGVTTAAQVVAAVNNATTNSQVAEYFTASHVEETGADGAGLMSASADAGSFEGGVNGGEIIATANDVIDAINAATGQDVVTASLAEGNNGYGVVSDFSEVAYSGSAEKDNELQFMAPEGAPNVQFVSTPGSSLNIDTTTDPRIEGRSSTIVQSSDANASISIMSKFDGTEFDGYTFEFADNAAVTAGNEFVVMDRESKTITVNIEDGVSTADEIVDALNADSYVSEFFQAENFGTSDGSGTFTVANLDDIAETSGGLVSEGTLIVTLGTDASGLVTTTANDLVEFFNDPSKFIDDSTEAADVASTLEARGISLTNVGSGTGNGLLAATSEDITFSTSGTDLVDAQASGTTNAVNGENAQMTFTAINSGADYDGVQISFVNDATVTGGTDERAAYDANSKTLTFYIEEGVTTADDIEALLQVGGPNEDEDLSQLFTVAQVGDGSGLVTSTDVGKLTGGVVDNGTVDGATLLGNSDLENTGLTFVASQYGSSSFVSVKALSGTFSLTDADGAIADRSVGTNVDVRINGIQAVGDGLKAEINTSSLDMSFSLSDSVDDNSKFEFSIVGGGALFQLGPNVVSNQQARLGVQSVSTATLGGVSGRLFELRSGGEKSLTNDVGGAARVVDEVITAVTQLRGRLGAFQKTTLDSNIFTLNDTLANLTDAESSIRDADFAAESAKLTRAQILVQSGTSVLGIANQNPQNVLGLLR
ncbi:MAG: flagellin [Pirellulaceae bacterium]